MLKITLKEDLSVPALVLEGRLAGPWTSELERVWKEVSSHLRDAPLRIELAAVSYIDPAGKTLLGAMRRAGAELYGGDCLSLAILSEICGEQKDSAPSRPKAFRRMRRAGLLALPFLLLASPSLRAQQPPPLKLTLHDAVQLAVKQNPQIQIAALELGRSQQDRAIARSALLPRADLDLNGRAVRTNIQASIGVTIPNVPQHTGPFQVFQVGPSFSAPVLDLALWQRWQAARHGVSAADAGRLSVREQVVLLVVSQYLGCLRATADETAAAARVQLAQALYDQAVDLQAHGVGTGVDTLRANVELQNEKQRRIEAETDRRTALYGLARLLDLDPHQDLQLSDEMSFFETPEFAPDGSIERAFVARPELRQLQEREKSLEAQRRAVSESRLPAIRFLGDYAQQGVSVNTVIPTYTYQVDVAMPLFTGGLIRAEIRKTDLERRQVEQQILDARNEIALEVKTALAQLDAARNEVQVAHLGVTLAHQEVEQARDRFAAGVTNNIEVTSAQDALARANDNQIAALYRFSQARADLARAIGQMELLYSK